jgi:hypothetical protein
MYIELPLREVALSLSARSGKVTSCWAQITMYVCMYVRWLEQEQAHCPRAPYIHMYFTYICRCVYDGDIAVPVAVEFEPLASTSLSL